MAEPVSRYSADPGSCHGRTRGVSGGNGWATGRLVVVGMSHQTAPVELRERLALEPTPWYDRVGSTLPTVLLSTCNRVEVYTWAHGRGTREALQIRRALARAAVIRLEDLEPHLFTRNGADALVHLVRVTAGLDSLVVGEGQIRGQVREAHRIALERGSLPPPLDGVFRRALESSRRLGSGSFLGRQPSVATAGVHAALRLPELGPSGLAGRLAVVLGAGAMAKSAARALLEAGARVVLLNRTPSHADRLRDDLRASRAAPHGEPGAAEVATGGLDDLPALLRQAALLVGTTAARSAVVDVPVVQAAMAGRSGEPLVILDVAVPRDVEPGVRQVPGVRVLDLDDLERLCPVDAGTRRGEIERVELLAREEAEAIARWLRVRAVASSIVVLRQFGQEVRQIELARKAQRLKGLTPEQWAAVEALAEGIVNKLLHGPTIALRAAALERPGSDTAVLALLRLGQARHRRR